MLLIDLSVEEAEQHVPVLREHGLDTIFLATPTSTPQRLEAVARFSSGFVYLVSRTGVTGERQALSSSVPTLVRSMREKTDLPLAVGFGISNPGAGLRGRASSRWRGRRQRRSCASSRECAGSADLETEARAVHAIELRRDGEAAMTSPEGMQRLTDCRDRVDEIDFASSNC